MAFIDPVERAAFGALWRRLGLWGAVWVGLAVRRRVKRGEPFAGWTDAEDAKEAGSRAQLGPAVALYRELQARGRTDAREVVAEAVHDGALAFLGATVGPIRRADLEAMDDAGRRTWLEAVGDRFPNATVRWEQTGPDAVRFRVTSCRFVALCRALDVPELAPVFCAGDATFFGSVEPNVTLTRPTTLAEGGDHCLFTLEWRD